MKKYKYLNKHERNEIEILRNKGYSIRSIATVLGRSPNTVSKELKRVKKVPYTAKLGNQYACMKIRNRRYQWRKLNRDIELQKYVVEGLKKGWNPHEIAGRLKYKNIGMNISAVTIYKWVLTDVRGERYKKYLYMYRFKRKRPRKRGLHGQIKRMISIHERPRISKGDWETDLVVSSRSGVGALSTSNELVSKYLVVDYVPNRTSLSKQKTLNRLEKEFVVESITFDRGRENSRHYECSSKTYFCDAYSSYQRGANENQNKLLRRWFPKGTDFSKVSPLRLRTVVNLINEKPRKSLGFRSAREVAEEIGIIRSVLVEG